MALRNRERIRQDGFGTIDQNDDFLPDATLLLRLHDPLAASHGALRRVRTSSSQPVAPPPKGQKLSRHVGEYSIASEVRDR